MKAVKAVLFVRVSKDQQDYQRQIDDLTKFAELHKMEIVGTIAEKVGGTKENRKSIQELMQDAKAGKFEAVLVTELPRLGRNAVELQNIIEELSKLKILLCIQNLNIRSLDDHGRRSPYADLLIAIVGQFAQMERVTLIERINSGLDRARKKGKVLGRKKGTTKPTDQFLLENAHVLKRVREGLPVRDIAKLCDCSINTIQKVKRAYLASIPIEK